MKKLSSPFPDTVKCIGLAAPSKAIEPETLQAVCAMLDEWGIEYVCAPGLCSAGDEDYFAADDATRLYDLNTLIRDESIQLILCVRGGYGAGYLLENLDYAALKRRNLPVCGYSDISALHLAMLSQSAGVPVECQMAARIQDAAADQFTADSMKRTLAKALGMNPEIPDTSIHLTRIAGPDGAVSGRLIPENLTVLASLCGSRFLPDWHGAILAIEDVDEEPRKLDRMLLQLELNGVFDRISALVTGHFTGECGTEADRLRILKRFADRHGNIPFFTGLPFGHELPSLSFVVGGKITITAENTLFI